MELIRLLLIKYEKGEELSELPDYSTADQIYNLQLMHDANLILATFVEDATDQPQLVMVDRLTWAGHDFLDATCDNQIWKMAKEKVFKPGASWTFSLLTEWLKQEAHNKIFGVPTSS